MKKYLIIGGSIAGVSCVEGIRSQVHNFAGEAPQSDDVTVLVIRRKNDNE